MKINYARQLSFFEKLIFFFKKKYINFVYGYYFKRKEGEK